MTDQELYEQATAASADAYAPYSKFLVGAAALLRDGRVITGVNVENASYPLGMCAERCALARAVAEGARPGDVEAVAVTASPCGGSGSGSTSSGSIASPSGTRTGSSCGRPPSSFPDSFEL